MKVGILGGSFNPIHNGHIRMAGTAYEELDLDKVLIMPTGNPPHKSELLDSVHRCNMINLAIKDYDYLELSDIELQRKGTIYTADTLKILCQENPDIKQTFILGADSLLSIESWYKHEQSFKHACIAACQRDDLIVEKMNRQKKYLQKKYNAVIYILNFEGINVSSNMIRGLIGSKQKKAVDRLDNLINADVLEYIQKEGLYI